MPLQRGRHPENRPGLTDQTGVVKLRILVKKVEVALAVECVLAAAHQLGKRVAAEALEADGAARLASRHDHELNLTPLCLCRDLGSRLEVELLELSACVDVFQLIGWQE